MLLRNPRLFIAKATAPPNAAPKKPCCAAPHNESWEKFIFPGTAFFNAWRGVRWGRGAACSAAFAMINSKVNLFLTRGAAFGGAAPSDFSARRSAALFNARRLVGPYL